MQEFGTEEGGGCIIIIIHSWRSIYMHKQLPNSHPNFILCILSAWNSYRAQLCTDSHHNCVHSQNGEIHQYKKENHSQQHPVLYHLVSVMIVCTLIEGLRSDVI